MSFNVVKDNSGRIIRKNLNPDVNGPDINSSSSLSSNYSIFSANANTLILNSTDVLSSATELNKTNVTPGLATIGKPLVLDNDKNITNLNSITCSNIVINGNSLGNTSAGANQFLNNITPGLVENSKALVLDSNRNINTLNNVDVNELLIENADLTINNKYESYCNKFITNELNNSNNWISMCWADTLNLFIAISNSGTGNRVMTSPDGITWTVGSTPVDNNWTAICWSKTLSLLVVVSSSGTNNRVMTSYDGFIWTTRITPVDNNWSSVCWSNELLLFVAVASSGNNDKVMTSPNGINWTIRTSPYQVNNNTLNNNTLNSISAGALFSLCLLNDGTVKSWGLNVSGQLGNNTTTQANVPIVIPNLRNVLSISAGNQFAMALLADGSIKSWGYNGNGQLGNNTTTTSYIPINVLNISNPIAISAGYSHSMALLADGTIKTWGSNSVGELGDNTLTQRLLPVTVYGIYNAIAISAGFQFSMALLADGTIKTWGYNNSGQLGDGTIINKQIPVFVSGITNAIAISAGKDTSASGVFAMALLADGTIKAWGSNSSGQLGNNSQTNSSIPVSVLNINNAIKISTGVANGYALLSTGVLKSWGSDSTFALGTPLNILVSKVPIDCLNINGVVDISAGSGHGISLLADGSLYTWGNNSNGQLGINSTVNKKTSNYILNNIKLSYDTNWNSICWSKNLNLFVSVGSGDYSSLNRIMTSTDGINWNLQIATEYNDWSTVIWASEIELFIAMSKSGNNRIMTSSNGIKWNSRNSNINNDWRQIAWSNDFKIAMAICNNYGNSKIILSSDGINWVPVQTNIKKKITSITWSNTLKKFCLLTENTDPYNYLTNWQISAAPIGTIAAGINNSITSQCRSVSWISQLNIFIITGLNGKLLTSIDGNNWTLQTVSNINLNINSVTYSPDLNLLVAVGDGSSTTPCVMTSNDGITWTNRTGISALNWIKVTWGNGLFVAIAQNATTSNTIMTSSNGILWTNRSVPVAGEWWNVKWINELNIFLAIGTSGARLMTSPNGIDWTIRIAAEENNWKDFAWSPTLNLLVAVANSVVSNGSPIMTSSDGIIWTSQTAPVTNLYSVIWAHELNLFVAMSFNNNPSSYLYSNNGKNWQIGFTLINQNFYSIAWSGLLNKFVSVSTSTINNENIISSVPNTNDTNMYSLITQYDNNKKLNLSNIIKNVYPSKSIIKYGLKKLYPRVYNNNNNWKSIIWVNFISQYVVIGSSSSVTKAGRSSNGRVWTDSAAFNIGFEPQSIAFSSELNIIICVGNLTGSTVNIYSSSNGNGWTPQVSQTSNFLTSACWSSDLMLFVVVSNTGNYNRAIISTDGSKWTPQSTSNNNWNSVCWSSELSLFVAVASSGTNRVMTSSDGINWIERLAASNLNWTSICWSPELLLFVAVASSINNNQIMTSSDGINWISQTSPENNNWNCVIWVADLRVFVAVASSGINRLMFSFNGSLWKTITLEINNSWSSISWSKNLGLFTIVSTDGLSNRICQSRIIKITNLNSPVSNLLLTNDDNKLAFCTLTPTYTHQFEYGSLSTGSGFIYMTTPNYGLSIYTSSTSCTLNSSGGNVNIQDHDGISSGLSLNNTLITSTASNINTLTNLKLGYASPFKPLLLDSNKNIININSVNCNNITLNSLFSNLVEGVAQSDNLIISNSNKEIKNINTLGANAINIQSTKIISNPNKIISNVGSALTFNLTTNPPYINSLVSGCWSPELSIFVAVTNWISNSYCVAISNDGFNWTPYTISGGPNLSSVCWSSKLSIFVASSSNNNSFYISSDGITWIEKSSPYSNTFWSWITWSPELEIFTAVANGANQGFPIITSSDGITWNKISGIDSSWKYVIYLKNRLIAVANNNLYISINGIDWTLSSISSISLNASSIAYSPSLDLFVLVGVSGSNRIAISSNLTSWTITTPPIVSTWSSVIWINELNLFIAVANTGDTFNRIIYSLNGITWRICSNSSYNYSFSNILWSPSLSRIVLLTNTYLSPQVISNSIYANSFSDSQLSKYTTDLNSIVKKNTIPIGLATNMLNGWIQRSNNINNSWTSVCYSLTLGLFVAVASSGTGNRIMTSSNGITWISRVNPVDNDWTSICWASELNLFVAVASSGTGNRIMTSSNGITWISQVNPIDNNWTSICWAPELNLFVAVANSGTENRIMTSSDGITWISQVNPIDNNWSSICWAPELNLFVAVANSGTGNRIMTSSDGITWTVQSSPADYGWKSICWANTINTFIAVANNGLDYNKVMISNDGINWSLQYCNNNNNWQSIIWISELQLAVAIANSNPTFNTQRLMSSPNGIDWTLNKLNIEQSWNSIAWASDLGFLCAISNSNSNNQIAHTIMTYPTSKNALIAYPNQLTINNLNRTVGLGIESPSYQLHLSTDSAFKLSTSTWTISSDIRLKKNIQNADLDDCFNKVKSLPLKRYKWKDNIYNQTEVTDRTKIGWIADDVQLLFPNSVKEINAHGYEDCKTINCDQIIASLYGCVQKLITISENKKIIIENLENKLNSYKNIINNLEIVEE